MSVDLDELTARLNEGQILNLFLHSGCKEPKKMVVNPKTGWTTIRCSEHPDEENPRLGKKASMKVNLHTGAFKCMSCGYSGNLLTIAKRLTSGNAAEAFKLLKAEAGIVEDGRPSTYKPLPKPKKEEPKPLQYTRFDPSKPYRTVYVEDWVRRIESLSKAQQYKLILTAIYRASLKTPQGKKLAYYESRGIGNNPKLELIGFVHKGDSAFWIPIEQKFGIEKLIEFGFYNASDAKWRPLSFKFDADMCFVPSFDLYSDTLTGAMLRPVEKPKNGAKEWSLNRPDLVAPVPFAVTRECLLDTETPMYITEGHIDGLSLGKNKFAAIPGVHSFKEEDLGLFEGQSVCIAFDMDRAGKDAALELKQKLLRARASKVIIVEWDESLGKDLNDLLLNGQIKKILKFF